MERLGIIIGVIIAWIALAILMAFPTMWLWNYLMPRLFELPMIDWFTALCINILCSILFKGSSNSSS